MGGTLNAALVLPCRNACSQPPSFPITSREGGQVDFLKDKIAQSIRVSKRLKLKPNEQLYISGGI